MRSNIPYLPESDCRKVAIAEVKFPALICFEEVAPTVEETDSMSTSNRPGDFETIISQPVDGKWSYELVLFLKKISLVHGSIRFVRITETSSGNVEIYINWTSDQLPEVQY